MTSFRREAREAASEGGVAVMYMVILAVGLLAIVALFTAAHYGALPWLRQQETSINRSSQGYVEAKQQQLLGMAQDYRRTEADMQAARQAGQNTSALEAQQKATLDRLETEARLLQREDVPDSVIVILNTNGRRI